MSQEHDQSVIVNTGQSAAGENIKIWIECLKNGEDLLAGNEVKILNEILKMEIDLCWMEIEKIHTEAVAAYKKEKAEELAKSKKGETVVNLEDMKRGK